MMPKPSPSSSVRILLLEDDFTLSSIIEEYLSEHGYAITCAYDGESALDKAYEIAFDLYLFDVKVPFFNGFDLLRELRRQHKKAPAIFITSLNSIEDLSQAYEAGCDDYLKKPFELKELELRIRALLKRSSHHDSETPIQISEEIIFDPKLGQLHKSGETIILPRKEAKILKILLANPDKIISSALLLESAWDFEEEASEETLRTHIKNLRKHLGKETILNIRGQGYQIVHA